MDLWGSRKRVGVIRGGPSPEYEISLKTGSRVLSLDIQSCDWRDIFIDRHGVWHLDGMARKASSVLSSVDGVFNALHGNYGENGEIQEMLDSFGVPYTGSGRIASAVSARKDLTLDRCVSQGIQVPITLLVREGDPRDSVLSFSRRSSFPLVVKPVSAGSSVGINIASSEEELNASVDESFKYSSAVLVQEYIEGKEASCGVIEGFRNEKLYPLLPAETVPHFSNFFEGQNISGYNHKTFKRCPGKFGAEDRSTLQRLASTVHQLLGLRHYSCSDFVVSPDRGVFFLEINSLPALNGDSVFSLELEASGISMEEFVGGLLKKIF